MKLVIVESPKKAISINKYLGNEFTVIASMGHIRDLPSKNGSVDPDNHFKMIWETSGKAQKQIQLIKKEAKKCDEILLATDPDREGEAISWHIKEIINETKQKTPKPIKRIVFNEINKNAILKAIENPRDIDEDLVQAYLARRALDYLVGFNLSPVLWRKLPGSRSAGRVQSVALRLVSDREEEIEKFKQEEYWSIIAIFSTATESKNFSAKLTKCDAKKLTKISFQNKQDSDDIITKIQNHSYHIANVDSKKIQKKPTAPFSTSTLQQEAARKLGFSAKKTMVIAQKLYEGIDIDNEAFGLITYMRTDSVNISQEALTDTINYIKKNYAPEYLAQKPNIYKSKAKNAQEAHEAIRPANIEYSPTKIKKYLDKDQFHLYELIWKRMLTSQMSNAIFDQVTIKIGSADQEIEFSATGTTNKFDGFMKIYQEGLDNDESENEKLLPKVTPKENAKLHELNGLQHFTKPPARYSEASIIKALEELGIGRPSTYAPTISTLIDREYVRKEKKNQLIPEIRGRIVTSFLVEHFPKYLEYDFTAKLEEQLDDIAMGKINWEKTLQFFWTDFNNNISEAQKIKISEVIDLLNESLALLLFGQESIEEQEKRKCTKCANGILSLKLGKFGAFIGCSNYPDCNYIGQLGNNTDEKDGDTKEKSENVDKLIGKNVNDIEIWLKKGPYGMYLQWGEQEGKVKPKRISIPKNIDINNITLNLANDLEQLPKNIGQCPNGKDIIIGQGKFGPYIKYDNKFVSIPKTIDFLKITEQQAIEILQKSKKVSLE